MKYVITSIIALAGVVGAGLTVHYSKWMGIALWAIFLVDLAMLAFVGTLLRTERHRCDARGRRRMLSASRIPPACRTRPTCRLRHQ